MTDTTTPAERTDPGAEQHQRDAMLQRDAARLLHVPVPGVFPPECRTCNLFSDFHAEHLAAAWPCETAQALGASTAAPWTAPWGP